MWEKKNKGTIEYDKRTVTCDVGTTQCKDVIVNVRKKKGNHQMWQKNCHMWCWNYTMWE